MNRNKIRPQTYFYRLRQMTVVIGVMALNTLTFGQEPANFNKKIHRLYRHTVPLITAEQLKVELEKDSAPVILDTREQEEFEVSHILNARYVGYNKFRPEAIKDIPKETPVVVYCSLGVRSEMIGEKLRKAGYKNVRNLFGGIFAWVHRDYPIFDKNNQPTQKVHAYSKKWGKWLYKGEKVYKNKENQCKSV